MLFEKRRKKTGGKQRGTKNKSTILFDKILESEKENLVRKAIELAIQGNSRILCKLLDKLIPNLNRNENENKNYNVDFEMKLKELKETKENNNLELLNKF
ncbi:MAG: hypothetical protein M3R36_05945 [Bacteroidota bacterium]|nr:hypothetical protein [Bacteroidota bacterium]